MLSKYLSDEDSFIIPFLWIREGEHSKIAAEIEKIYQTGCHAFCVEARPYAAFCKEPWFYDLDLIIEEAKKIKMRVYLLDDCTFPTGYANGLIKNKYPELRAHHLRESHTDVVGIKKNGKVIVQAQPGEQLVAAVAYKHIENRYVEKGIILTQNVHDGILYWDIPEGNYRVVFIFDTLNGIEKHDFIDMMNPKSVDCLIEGCYEPHYARYKSDFGMTIAGFFSDEPRFANGMSCAYMTRASSIGNAGLALPYSSDIPDLLSSHLGVENADNLLGGLWFETPGYERIRRAYMDIISLKFQENFSMKISTWCNERNVVHIGHVIEDMGTHCKTMNGAGHFFRSTSGFDMGGIDIVLGCLMPFQERFNSAYIWDGESDGNFYQYTLAKLGASSAHLQPKKQGRALCEVFGAYGHGENLALMKWLADHMLVRGIQYFIPHAFSMRYPDSDCPPHFSNGNPIYRNISVLFDYMTSISRILYGSTHIAPTAVLYHAELEWSGSCMPSDTIAAILTKNQIDFDIIPFDSLLEPALNAGNLVINQECYKCLVIPYAEYYPDDILESINKLAEKGFPVVYSDKEGTNILPILHKFADVRLQNEQPNLVYYKCRKNGHIIYMFFNEGNRDIDTTVTIVEQGAFIEADVLKSNYIVKESNGTIPLCLQPYESRIFIFDDDLKVPANTMKLEKISEVMPEDDVYIYLCPEFEFPNFKFYKKVNQLIDITGFEEMPHFNGYIKYEFKFFVQEQGCFIVDFGECDDSFEVLVNGNKAGTLICPPYTLDLSKDIIQGENQIIVICSTTPVFEQRDYLSQFLTLGASGLTEIPKLEIFKNRNERDK